MTAELPVISSSKGPKKTGGKGDKKKTSVPNAKAPKRNDTVLNIPLSAHIPGRPVNTSSMALIRQIIRYDKQGIIPHTEKVLDGFKADTIFNMQDGQSCETVIVDRAKDPVLKNTIQDFRQQASKWGGASDIEKAHRTMDYVNTKMQGRPTLPVNKTEEKLLGSFISESKGVNRHKVLLFKVLADDINLKTDVFQGKHSGRTHAWNIVHLPGNKKLAVDTTFNEILDDNQLAGNYWYCNRAGTPVYASPETVDIMKPISNMKPGETLVIGQKQGENTIKTLSGEVHTDFNSLASIHWDEKQNKFFIQPMTTDVVSLNGKELFVNRPTEIDTRSEIQINKRQLRFNSLAVRNNNTVG